MFNQNFKDTQFIKLKLIYSPALDIRMAIIAVECGAG